MSDLCNPELFEKVVAGTATSAETAALEAHAVECATCARELSWQKRERALFAGRTQRAAGDLWPEVERRIATPAVAPRRPASWTAGLVAAAAAVLVMIKVVPMAMHHGPQAKLDVIPAQGASLPAGPEAPKEESVTREWTVPLPDDARITIAAVNGSVDVAMADRKDVRILAEGDLDEDDPAGWHLQIDHKGKDVSVRFECQHACKEQPDVDLHVTLPSSSRGGVVVDTIAADVEVHAVTTPVVAHSVSGDVQVDHSTLVEVATTSGDIEVDDASSRASKLSSVSGDVQWRGLCGKGCALRVSTVSGDVSIEPEAGSSFKSDIHEGQTHRTMERDGASGLVTLTTVSGDVEVGESSETAAAPAAATKPALVAAGFVAARTPISIGSATGGVVREVKVAPGATVNKDDIVVTLDASAAEAELAAISAEIKEAENQLRMVEKLFNAGAATSLDVGKAKSALAITRTKMVAPEAKIRQSRVRSFTAGTVVDVLVHPGETVPPNTPVVKIADLRQLDVEIDVDEGKAHALRRGQRVEVTSAQGDEVEGVVSEIGTQVDEQRGVVLVKVALDPQAKLHPGMSARASFLPLSESR